jgi:hypothetical protein
MSEYCVMCGSSNWIEHHHIFGGALRKKSEKYRLVVPLCHYCHNEPPNGVHHNKANMLKLHQYGQRKAMQDQGWSIDDFRREFYKNYL